MKRYIWVPVVTLAFVNCTNRVAATSDPTGSAGLSAAPAASAQPVVITVPEGTVVKVRTMTTLSTKTNKAGERFIASLADPIVVDGVVAAPRGANVQGIIADSDDGGRVKGRAHLSLRLTGIEMPGRQASVATNTYTVVARGTRKRDAMKIGIGSGIGAAIGAIAGGGAGAAIGAGAGAGAGAGYVLATHGAPAVIPSERVLTFRLRSAARI